MNTSEPHDSILHSEAASTTGAESGDHGGRRFIDDAANTESARAADAGSATPDQQRSASVPDFVAPDYGASVGGGSQPYPDPASATPPNTAPPSAAPTGFPPPPPPAPAPGAPLPPPQPNAYPPPMAVSGQPEPLALDSEVPERVGRGVFFSLGGIVLGIVATVVLWQLNFIAAFTSLVMAWACIWLYTKGAGRPPRKGTVAVVAVIALGVILALVSAIASDAVVYANQYFVQPSVADYVDTIVLVLSTPEVWSEYGTSIAMYVLFAALGTVGIIMQLARGKQTS